MLAGGRVSNQSISPKTTRGGTDFPRTEVAKKQLEARQSFDNATAFEQHSGSKRGIAGERDAYFVPINRNAPAAASST